jgi:predicted permease
MRNISRDLQYGARMLLKKPGFTLVAVITLALGVGANTAIFSVINALMLRPLSYTKPDQLVLLGEKSREGKRITAAYPNFDDWRARAQSFEGMASTRNVVFTMTGERPQRLRGRTVNWNFFQLLGTQPQLGRQFVAADDTYGASRTALISHGMWQAGFAGDAKIIGKTIMMDGDSYTIVGVLPLGFEYFRTTDVYVPIGLFLRPKSGLTDRGSSLGLYAIARLKPGVTVEQANSEMSRLGTQLAQEYPTINGGKSAMAQGLQDVMSEDVRSSLLVLLGAVGFILLIACINVANLLLVRAADRQKEIALRLALGAGRWRIIRQLLSESFLLTLVSGALGLLLGRWMLEGLLALAPEDIPQISRVGLDKTVLLFTLGVTAATTVLCGLLPALQASHADLQTTLKEGGRSILGSSRERMRKSLLVVEVSLALVLLAGAGLLLRSMYNLLHVDPGFNAANLLTLRFNLTGAQYNPQTGRIFYDQCLARVSAVPGVQSAALTLSLPIDGSYWDSVFIVADKPAPPRSDLPDSDYIRVSANYFQTMGIRLLKGRLFNASDTATSTRVVVVNETLARRMWPGEDPIGKRVKQGFPENAEPWREVIGVVNDVKLNGVDSGESMETYLPFIQDPGTSLALVVRTSGNPLAASAAVERAIHSIDKDLAVYAVLTMDQLLRNSLAQRRLTLVLLASFAVLALLLAALGVYGVISYSVRRRTHELGLRIALGAQSRDVLKLILTQGLKLALVGVVIGLLAAFALTRWMESMLFEVRPTDPLTFMLIALALTMVALVACWIPARRAAKLDPIVALRDE